MSIYDYEGNEISLGSELTDEQIRLAFSKALTDGTIKVLTHIGDTLGIDSGTAFNTEYMNTAYASLLAAYKAHPNSVPFFIHSDQHGRGLDIQRYANNLDVDGLEYANINGGDTVVDTYGTAALESAYEKIKYVKNYLGVAGNHDYKKPSGEDISPYIIRNVFSTTNLEKRMITTCDLSCYVAYHPKHTVKFICLDLYDSRGIASGMAHPYVNSEVADWLIDELNRNDGYDIVVIVHEPQFITYKQRDDAEYTSSESHELYDLLLARKNKTSGTYTDAENETHSFDFTNAKDNLLCMLSGHWHGEVYSDADGLTVYVQDWAGNNKYGGTFGLIDRDSDLLRIFSFDNVNGVKEELDLSLQ